MTVNASDRDGAGAGNPSFALAPDAYTGKKLGKYDVLCRLSTGGMSVIFLAFQRGLAGFKKLVVLKKILPDIKGEEEFVRMFLEEAKITAAFTHPNIAHVYDLDIADGELFLAMEFVEGATMVEIYEACRSAGQSIPIGLTLAAVRDTALALHYAHTFTDPAGRVQTTIHRDVAEKNVMVTYDGGIKLLDFGIAKRLGRANRTEVGTLKGTSGYMSPEQILGETLDARSDVFSLGIVLHQCMTGVRLFYGKTPSQEIEAALKAHVYPPSRSNPSVTEEIDEVVLKALARKREDRYESALEFARALENAAGPQLWPAEKRAEFVLSYFNERRERVRKFISEMQAGFEHTGEISLQLFLEQGELRLPSPQNPWESRAETTRSLGPRDGPANGTWVHPVEPPRAERDTTTSDRPWKTGSLEGLAAAPLREATVSLPLDAVLPEGKRKTGDEIPATHAPPRSRDPGRRPRTSALLRWGIVGSSLLLVFLVSLLFVQEQRRKPLGRLVLHAYPTAAVFWGSQELGLTPLKGVRLPVGQVNLRLIGPDRQARSLRVEIKPQTAVRMDVKLRELPSVP